MLDLSKRITDAPSSPIRKLVPLGEEAKRRGVNVYHLNMGDPDIPTPLVLLDRIKSFPYKIIRYPRSQGEPEIISSVLSYYRKLGLSNLKEENLLITSGASEAILLTFLAICDNCEEIIVFEPFYANYNGMAAMAGVKLVPITTDINNGFHIKNLNIERAITKKTRAILLCSPNNPTGTVYTKEEIENLLSICKKHNLYLLVDEAYREFVYDGKKLFSVLSYKDKNIIVFDSFSKRYSLCGLRLGMLVSYNKEIISSILKYAQIRLASGFVDQYIASAVSKVPESYFKKVNSEYEKRRNLVYKKLTEIEGVKLVKPEGAFYVMAKLPVLNTDHFAKWLLTDFSDNKETIMVAPGSGFYISKGMGLSEVRIAYVISQKDLYRAIDILKTALYIYKRLPTSVS